MTPETTSAAVKVVGNVISHPANGGSISSWLTFAAIISGVIAAYFGILPKLREAQNKRLDNLDDERRNDMETMRARMDALETKAENAGRLAQAAENKLSAAVSAITLLKAEVRKLDPNPDNDVLRLVDELLAAATSGDLGFGVGLSRITAAVAAKA